MKDVYKEMDFELKKLREKGARFSFTLADRESDVTEEQYKEDCARSLTEIMRGLRKGTLKGRSMSQRELLEGCYGCSAANGCMGCVKSSKYSAK